MCYSKMQKQIHKKLQKHTVTFYIFFTNFPQMVTSCIIINQYNQEIAIGFIHRYYSDFTNLHVIICKQNACV